MKFLYLCLTYLYVVPLGITASILRLVGDRTQVERLGWGLTPLNAGKRSIWLVASSVGEVNIALKLINRLKATTSLPVILTVTTGTGRSQAQHADSKVDAICYHPFDIGSCVHRFFRNYNPSLIVLVETELWPVLMEKALARGVRVMQVSGRISEKSLRRYLPFRPLFQPLLQRCERLMMQSEEDAERIDRLVGDRCNIEVIGSIKGDYAHPEPARLTEIADYLSTWAGARVITCGSTRPGEEEMLLEAFSKLSSSRPNLRLIIAPRHLDRVQEVTGIIQRYGLTFSKRSILQLPGDSIVLLLDTIGELNLFYHCSDVAFVGGTLVPIGGHNLLEPALAGCPVLFGPHCANQKASRDLLLKRNLGFQVDNVDEICATVTNILTDPESKKQFVQRAEALRLENASVVDTYVSRIIGSC